MLQGSNFWILKYFVFYVYLLLYRFPFFSSFSLLLIIMGLIYCCFSSIWRQKLRLLGFNDFFFSKVDICLSIEFFVWSYEPVWIYVHYVCTGVHRGQEKVSVALELELRCLWGTVGVQGVKPRPSAGAVSAPSQWALSAAPKRFKIEVVEDMPISITELCFESQILIFFRFSLFFSSD